MLRNLLIEDKIKKLIEVDRSKYYEIYKKIEKYISDNKLIVYAIENYVYKVYCNDSYKHCNDLTNDLYDKESNLCRYIQMKTVATNTAYSISVNERQLIDILEFDNTNNIDLYKLTIEFYVIEDKFSMTDLSYLRFNNFISLLNTYHNRYDIECFNKWIECDELLFNKKDYYQLLSEQLLDKFKGKEVKLHNNKDIENILNMLLELQSDRYEHSNIDYVLIGKYAIDIQNDELIIYDEPIQIISSIPKKIIEFLQGSLNETNTVNNLDNLNINKDKLDKKNNDEPIQIKKSKIRIFDDFRLKRYVVNYNGKNVLEIYNSSKYELIPYKYLQNKSCDCDMYYCVASSIVIYRFLFINIWIMNLLVFNKQIPIDLYRTKIKNNVKYIRLLYDLEDNDDNSQYYGTVINKLISYKKLIKSKNDYIPDYYPYLWEKEHNELKKVK